MSKNDLPPEFRQMLGLDRPQRDTLATVVALPLTGDAAARYGTAALTAECDRVATATEGTRNHTLNKAAFNLAQLVAQGILDEHTVADNLRAAAAVAGLPEREIDATLASAGRGAASKPRPPVQLVEDEAPAVTVITDDDVAAETGRNEAAEADDVAASVRKLFPTIDWHDLWADDTEDEWILEPILPARRMVALYSPPKVGKSLLLLELAMCIAQGSPVLGTVPQQKDVLYVDFENDPRGDVRARLKAMGAKPGDLDHLHYLSYPTLAKLDTERGGLELVTIARTYGCEVVVIDTISRAVGGEENENDTWLNFYRSTGLALKQAGIACIRLDHTGKDAERGMRGGSAKYGDVDAVWRLTGVTEDTYRLDCTDHRLPISEKTIVFRRATTPHLHSDVQAEGRMAAHNAKVMEVIKALDALGVPNDVGREVARRKLSTTGVTARNDAIAEAVSVRKKRIEDLP